MLIERICASLGLPPTYVAKTISSASHAYKQYSIPKQGGGTRTIFHPARPLKGIQRWLAMQVIATWPVHHAAMAYRRGISILDNARLHSDSHYLLRMDFAGFFESIKETDLRRYAEANRGLFDGWTEVDVDFFCRACCRFGQLTIGAPTSPSLANALCYELDAKLESLCASQSVTYSRYADDLFFSVKRPDVLIGIESAVVDIVGSLSIPAKLSLNSAKTRHTSKKGARRVTGIVLGSDGIPYIGRDLKRRIRAMIHRYEALDSSQRATLSGLISYAVGFDPDFKNSLIAKYGLPAVHQAEKSR